MSIDKYLKAGNERPNSRNEKFPSGTEPPTPNGRDYERGYFERYFLRRKNTSRIFEVSEDEYQQFDGNSYFVRFSLKWRISGPRHDVYNDDGYPVATGVEDTNVRVTEKTNQKGIQDKLNDPLQYWDGRN